MAPDDTWGWKFLINYQSNTYVHTTAKWFFQKCFHVAGGEDGGSVGGIFFASFFLTVALCTGVQPAPGDTVSQKHCKSQTQPTRPQGC